MKSALSILIMVTVILGLLFSGISCTKTVTEVVYVTATPETTTTPALTVSPTQNPNVIIYSVDAPSKFEVGKYYIQSVTLQNNENRPIEVVLTEYSSVTGLCGNQTITVGANSQKTTIDLPHYASPGTRTLTFNLSYNGNVIDSWAGTFEAVTTDTQTLSLQQYKSSCTSDLTIRQLEKNPAKYARIMVTYTGQIYEIHEGEGFTWFTLLFENGSRPYWVTVIYDGTTDALRDDYVQIWGEVTGLEGYGSGDTVYFESGDPLILAHYISIGPMSTPTPTSTPKPISTPKPGVSYEEAAYFAKAQVCIEYLNGSMSNFTSLLNNPHLGENWWTDSVINEASGIIAIYIVMNDIIPPPSLIPFHYTFTTYLEHLAKAAFYTQDAMQFYDINSLYRASDELQAASQYGQMAKDMFDTWSAEHM